MLAVAVTAANPATNMPHVFPNIWVDTTSVVVVVEVVGVPVEIVVAELIVVAVVE